MFLVSRPYSLQIPNWKSFAQKHYNPSNDFRLRVLITWEFRSIAITPRCPYWKYFSYLALFNYSTYRPIIATKIHIKGKNIFAKAGNQKHLLLAIERTSECMVVNFVTLPNSIVNKTLAVLITNPKFIEIIFFWAFQQNSSFILQQYFYLF